MNRLGKFIIGTAFALSAGSAYYLSCEAIKSGKHNIAYPYTKPTYVIPDSLEGAARDSFIYAKQLEAESIADAKFLKNSKIHNDTCRVCSFINNYTMPADQFMRLIKKMGIK